MIIWLVIRLFSLVLRTVRVVRNVVRMSIRMVRVLMVSRIVVKNET